MAPKSKSTKAWHPTSFHSQNHPPHNPNPHHLAFTSSVPNYNPSFHSFHLDPPPPFVVGPQFLPQSTSSLLPTEPSYPRLPDPPLPRKPKRAATPEQDRPPGWYGRHSERRDGREYVGAAGFGHANCVERHTHPRDCGCGCRGRGRVTQTVLAGRLPESLPVPGLDSRTGRVAAAYHPLLPNPAYPYRVAPPQAHVPVSVPAPVSAPVPAPIEVSFPPRSSTYAYAPAPAMPSSTSAPGYSNAGYPPYVPGGWYGSYPAPMDDQHHVPFVPPPPPPPATTQGTSGRWAQMPSPATASMAPANVTYPSPYATTATTSMPPPNPVPVIFSPPTRPSAPMPEYGPILGIGIPDRSDPQLCAEPEGE